MFRNSLSWYIFTLSLLELIIKTHPTLYDSSHGFISKNPRYFDDELSFLHEEFNLLKTSRLSDVPLKSQLKFEPTFLDFKQRPMGMPHLEKVTLFNIDKNKSIDMTSISGSTVHFHSSFFHDKKIPPKGNTSFNVVFLGREEGILEDNLFIHTTEGFLKYNVRGASTFSHYRLNPISGVKLPFNSTFAPLIYLHNPHLEPLQIVEVQCSGGGFHLELPNGEQEGSNDLWEIASHETKAIIRVLFFAEVLKNYTAYVRIRLSNPNLTLVIPLEVEVTSDTEIIHPRGYVDLGMGGSYDPPTEVRLCLFNPNKKYVRVHSVSASSQALQIHYYNIRLPPAAETEDPQDQCVDVGTITVDWKTAYDTKDFSGKLIIKYRNGRNSSEIPYHLTVLKGGLSYDSLTTTYFVNDKTVDISSRAFKVKNEFEEYVYISELIFPHDTHRYFKIQNFSPQLLKPGEDTNIFNIKLKNNIRLSDLQLQSQIIIKTNISDIRVPLLTYNGKLQVHLPFKSKDYSLDIGLVGFNSKKEVYFMVVNPNPVTLHLKHVHSSIPMTTAEVIGCGSGDHRLVLFSPTFQNLTKCHNLKMSHYAVIKVTILTQQVEGQVWGDIYIETQFENLKIPVHFKIAPGKLEIGPDKLIFDQCFPAKICTHPIRVHSTFNEPMIIEDIITLPPDKRVTSRHTGHIHARTSKIVGHMFLNPDLECQADCYTGLQTDTSAQWLRIFSLSNYAVDFDIHLVNVFYNRYLNLTSNGTKKWQNITFRLDTSEVKGHIFRSRVKMSWPSLIFDHTLEDKSVINFPLTQLGNLSYYNVTIRNPASYNIVVQLVFDRDYPDFETLYAGLPPNLVGKTFYDKYSSAGFFFPNFTRNHHLNFFANRLGIMAHRESVPILLAPGQIYTFPVGFFAEDTDFHSAILLLRNNLTILEILRLNARATLPMFKFGNRKPGSLQPLMFEMTDKHFRDCEKSRMYPGDPNFTVKRTFTARNIGDVTLYIHSFHINDYQCEGYGFKVMDCEPFALHPNQTKKIDIAFTPDLSLTRISRTLILVTSLNIPVNYTLYTTIPPLYLTLCTDAISRPSWEIYLSYFTIVSMTILAVIILFIAAIDAERIRQQAMGTFILPTSSTVQPVLDLRLVGQQTREEIQSLKVINAPKEEKKCDPPEEIVEKEVEIEVKPKVEMERYTVLVPTTGKARRRLGKKSSFEPIQNEVSDIQVSEKIDKRKEKHHHHHEHKHKGKEHKEEKEAKLDEKDKKHVQNNSIKDKDLKKSFNKKHTKNITTVPAYEEETSSTATDSSGSLNEDPEKENNQRNITKVCSKLKISNIKSDSSKSNLTVFEGNSNHSTDFKCMNFNHNNHHNRYKHQKSATKVGKSGEKQNKENKDCEISIQKQNDHHNQLNGKHHGHQRDTKKRERIAKERKEKGFHKKAIDKHKQSERQNNTEKQIKNVPCFNIPLPTVTTTPSIWGESRAKFSDVVARNEASTTSTFSCSNAVNRSVNSIKPAVMKPTMYVEPYKQTAPTELGPIGSRRTDNRRPSVETHRDSNRRPAIDNSSTEFTHDGFLHGNALVNDRNSYFSDDIRLDGIGRDNGFINDLNTNRWSPQQSFGNVIDTGFSAMDGSPIMEDPWNQNLLNTSSYWDSYNPLLGDNSLLSDSSPLLDDKPLLSENSVHTDAYLSQKDTVSSASNVYLWGSSSVWQPWAPEVTSRTPTRTPPGFDEFVHRKPDDLPQQTRDGYSPFNTSPLWNQQQTNPWNYSQGQ